MAVTFARLTLALWAMTVLAAGLSLAPKQARALSIELKDVAADRVDRQRSFQEGALPLPGTPNVALLDERLRQKGVRISSPMLIRIFKSESELEIWKDKDGEMVLFATYPICHWSARWARSCARATSRRPRASIR